MVRKHVLMAALAVTCSLMLLVPAFAAVSSMSPSNSTLVKAPIEQAPATPAVLPSPSLSPSYAYVVNSNGTIAVVNTSDYSVVGSTFIGSSNPYWSASTPNGTLLLTVDDTTNNVTVVDLNTLTDLANISTPATPNANFISINPDGMYAYVAGYLNYNVSVISLATLQVVKVMSVAYDPNYVAISPNGTLGFAPSYNYASSANTHNLTVINTANNTVIANVSSPYINGPFYSQVSPNGSLLALANLYSENITLINTTTFKVASVIPLAGYPSFVSFSGNGKTLYATLNTTSNHYDFVAINMTSLSVSFSEIFSFMSGSGASFALSANGTYAYLSSSGTVVPALNLQTGSYVNITGFSGTATVVIPDSSFYSTAVFQESGLPAGTSWSATVAGQTYTSSSPTISLTGFATTYSYSIGTAGAYLYTYKATGNFSLTAVTITIINVLFQNRFHYSSSSNYAYVTANSNADQIGVLNLTTLKLVGNIPVGGLPYSTVVTPNGTLLLTVEDNTNNVTVTSLKTFTNIASIPTPSTPNADLVTVNPDGLYAYVAGYQDYNVSVISLSSFTVVKVLNVTYSPGEVIISNNGTLGFAVSWFAPHGNSTNFTVINTATNTVIANLSSPYLNDPVQGAFSPDGKVLAIADSNSNNITILNTTSFKVIRNVQVNGIPQWLAFNGNGSRLYTTTIYTNARSILSNLSIINTNTYGVQSMLIVNDSSLYSFALSENGSLLYAAGEGPTQGIFVVNLNTLSVVANLSYGSPFPITVPATAYYNSATFHESGLPSGTNWSVTFAGRSWYSTSQSLTVTGYLGNYSFSYTSGNSSFYSGSGSFAITPATTSTYQVAFTPVTYTVTFTETGLNPGASWYVVFNGVNKTSTTSTITFTTTNGTFSYVIGNESGYKLSVSSGTVTVSGAAQSESVSFTAVTHPSSNGGATTIAIVAAVVIIVVIVAVALFVMRGRKKKA